MDPKLLSGMDPKALFGGLDPRLFGFDPKMFDPKKSGGSAQAATSAAAQAALNPSLDPRLLGLDPKMLIGLDAKALQSLGLDPKIVSSLLEQQGGQKTKTPTTTTATAKISTSVTPTFSSLESR